MYKILNNQKMFHVGKYSSKNMFSRCFNFQAIFIPFIFQNIFRVNIFKSFDFLIVTFRSIIFQLKIAFPLNWMIKNIFASTNTIRIVNGK